MPKKLRAHPLRARRFLAEELRPQSIMRRALEVSDDLGNESVNVQSALRAIEAAYLAGLSERLCGVTEADLPF